MNDRERCGSLRRTGCWRVGLAALLACLTTASWALAPGDRVDNFVLLDQEGVSHELYYLSDARAVVVMVHGNGCAVVRNVLPRLTEIRAAYAEQGIEFLLINANLQDDRERVRVEARDYAIDFPILLDETQLVGESMGFVRTAEVFVIDPADRWKVIYRGPVDDRVHYERQLPDARHHYLTDALDALLADKPVATAQVDGVGCLVNFPERDRASAHAAISYTETIGPLLAEHCVGCHRPGGIGPFAMSDYSMVRGFAPMIREVVRTARMPPWHADPHHGSFANDRSLSVAEQQTLVHWVEAGAPRDEGPDPLVAAMAQDWPEWPLGEPDLIVELPPFEVPATGVIPYQHPSVQNPLDREVWVRALDFLPGDRQVVHHIIATHTDRPPEQLTARGLLGDGLGGYVPGGGATVYPEEAGVRLRTDAHFILQMHYTTSGRATTDVTRMGLYFHDSPPEHEHHTTVLINPRIRIPAHARRHAESAERTFDRDIVIYSLLPHAHFRGRASEFRAVYPDGSEEVLLSVPRYDFNWQHTYVLAEPKPLPAGTTLRHTTT